MPNYIKKTALNKGVKIDIKMDELKVCFYIVDGIRMGQASAYRRGVKSLRKYEMFWIIPTSDKLCNNCEDLELSY